MQWPWKDMKKQSLISMSWIMMNFQKIRNIARAKYVPIYIFQPIKVICCYRYRCYQLLLPSWWNCVFMWYERSKWIGSKKPTKNWLTGKFFRRRVDKGSSSIIMSSNIMRLVDNNLVHTILSFVRKDLQQLFECGMIDHYPYALRNKQNYMWIPFHFRNVAAINE